MPERTLDSPPNTLALYAKAALGSIPGASSLPFLGIGGGGGEMPDTELVLERVEVDPDRLAAYCRVCGFTLRDTLPPTYPHILGFPLQLGIMTGEDFPFGAVGLVHIANRIRQHRPLRLAEPLELRVRSGELRPHPKGRQFSLVTQARVGAELVWDSESTMLRRGSGREEERGEADHFAAIDFAALPPLAEWQLGGDLGRRYGGVSGDRNPIHMHSLTAKPLGFPSAIAHGMWTKARALAGLEGDLPDALEVEVRFKRPILLPARASFASAREEGRIAFAVRDALRGTPHLDGLLAPL